MDVEAWVAAAKNPTAEWLESCFGAGSLWRPREAELPELLQHEATRKFLTTVGFPAVRIDWLLECIDFDSSGIKEADGPWAEDPDELFGRRTPDDDSPLTKYAFGFGECSGCSLMLDGVTGDIVLYDPNGWDHAAGYAGQAHSSLPILAGALGLATKFREPFEGPKPLEVLGVFRQAIEALDPGVESALWEKVLETLEEEYELAAETE
ncbi:SUKH-4 family immunity protein [Streptomyces sp. NPDC048483]|uniref:SUKH-4 family immunity protein n=1 Tax=Streptomyces sp. NPDC048483 TaxID=3154927 RepID=UPI00341EF3D8